MTPYTIIEDPVCQGFTLNSSHQQLLSTKIPFPSNSTPSSFNNSSFFSQLIPLGAFCQSPWNPPIYCHISASITNPCSPHLASPPSHRTADFDQNQTIPPKATQTHQPRKQKREAKEREELTPLELMTRWQGTSGAKGLFLSAPPTALGLDPSAFDKAA